MRVYQIQKITDRKEKVFLEDGFSFVLYSREIRKYRISEGCDLPGDTMEVILDKVLLKRAKLRCMNLLKVSDRTVWQLRDRLQRDGYPEELIRKALEYVASYHYTDDERYAENYIRCHSGTKSRRAIVLELKRRGVDSEQIEEAEEAVLSEAGKYGEDEGEADKAAIRKLIEKRQYSPETADRQQRQKMAAYLAGKGFSMNDIREALKPDSRA